jgi:hypothetical protein
LIQISHGQLIVKKFDRYDINGFHFRTEKLEARCSLAATKNSGVSVSAYNADNELFDYYGIVEDITAYIFGVMTFDCIWFDPRARTRVDEFGVVEIKHTSRYKGNEYNNIVLAHQVN